MIPEWLKPLLGEPISRAALVIGVVWLLIAVQDRMIFNGPWFQRLEDRFEGWLARRFGEQAPMRLALLVLAVSAPLALYWVVSDFRRIWGL